MERARRADDPGIVPWAAQVVGYFRAIAGGVLLLAPGSAGRVDREERRLGVVLLSTVAALLLVDAVTAAERRAR